MGIPIPEFKVLLYGPALHAAGVRARAHFEGGSLAVAAHNGSFLVPSNLIRLRQGGFDGRQWLISWAAQEGTYSALLQSEAALQAFIHLAPEELRRQLLQSRGSHGKRRNVKFVLITLLALVPLLAVGVYWANAERLGEWVMSRISLEQERQLGDRAYQQVRPSLKTMDQTLPSAAVAAIGMRLTAESYYKYHFHVVVDPRINALALPGGHVMVTTGLLRACHTAGEFAGVLAHVISHVEERLALRKLVSSLGWRAVLGSALGSYSDSLWNDMADRLNEQVYDQRHEIAADRNGLEILRRADVAPHGMETFLVRMVAVDNERLPSLLYRHPADDARLAALRAAILAMPSEDFYPINIDWERVKVEL